MGTKQEGDNRKKEIIKATLVLFDTIGFEKTTVQSILDAVGIGKGTFYHHFKSKEEVIDVIINTNIDEAESVLKAVSKDDSLNALEKINTIHEILQNKRNEQSNLRNKLTQIYMKESNHILTYKYIERAVEKSKDLYASIIEQGIEEGTFDTKDPHNVAEIIIRVGSEYRGKLAILGLQAKENPSIINEINKTISFMHFFMARLLGVSEKKINVSQILGKDKGENHDDKNNQ